MDNFSIETAQNITINQNVANLTTRIKAFLIDLVFIIAYSILVIYIISWLDLPSFSDSMATYILLYLPIFFYSLIFETLMNGQTPGKSLSKIRVVKLDGSRPTFGSFLIRWVLRAVDIALSNGAIAILTILLNGKGQRLGDLAAGTTVISEKEVISLKNTIASDLEVDINYTPKYPNVALLSDKDINTIKNLYTDAINKRKHEVLISLYHKIIELTGIQTEQKPIDFIDTVLKDYNYYATEEGEY